MLGRTNSGRAIGGGGAGGGMITESDFSYSGNYLYNTDGTNYEIALLDGTNATLSFSKNPGDVEIFLVAGGQAGQVGSGAANTFAATGGAGGNGGGCVTAQARLQKDTSYSVTVGGSGASTTLSGASVNLSALSGNGSGGGAGGSGDANSVDGSDGVYAYGKSSDTTLIADLAGSLFGAGGGGGGVMIYRGSSLGWFSRAGGLGGESNGPGHDKGHGANGGESGTGATSGYANHGQGGGGALRYWWVQTSESRNSDPGAGGSGIILIRNAR